MIANQIRKHKTLIMFEDLIGEVVSNKKTLGYILINTSEQKRASTNRN